MIGVLPIPFVTFFIFLVTLKKLGWDLRQNIYMIFFLCRFTLVYASSGDLGHYAGAVLREFPIFTVVFLMLGLIWRVAGVQKTRGHRRAVQR